MTEPDQPHRRYFWNSRHPEADSLVRRLEERKKQREGAIKNDPDTVIALLKRLPKIFGPNIDTEGITRIIPSVIDTNPLVVFNGEEDELPSQATHSDIRHRHGIDLNASMSAYKVSVGSDDYLYVDPDHIKDHFDGTLHDLKRELDSYINLRIDGIRIAGEEQGLVGAIRELLKVIDASILYDDLDFDQALTAWGVLLNGLEMGAPYHLMDAIRLAKGPDDWL